jgi:nicotinamidase-related amidase
VTTAEPADAQFAVDQDMTQALLLMDLQNEIIDRYGATDDYLDRVVQTQERAEQAGVLVVLVRVAFSPGHPEISARNKTFAAVKAGRRMILGHSAVEPHPRLVRGNGEAVVLSTVREAADQDYEITVLEGLCLDGDEEVHRVLTHKVFPRQADVMTSSDWRPLTSRRGD